MFETQVVYSVIFIATYLSMQIQNSRHVEVNLESVKIFLCHGECRNSSQDLWVQYDLDL